MQLSIRLAAVADLAKGAKRLADIGTDHGYLPIFLAQQEKLEYAVAMDINRGPLLRAKENIRQYHQEEKITTRLSDGAEKLLPGEVDCVVIAGMGGPLTIRILTDGRKQLETVETLVLQPQSETELVRRFLHSSGYAITAENMVKDEGKLYPMMKAVRGSQEPWEDYEYSFGKYLIEQKNPCLKEFLLREDETCRHILEGLRGRMGENITERREELEERIRKIKKTMEQM